MCQYGQGVVRGLFEAFAAENLRGFVVWLPMLPGDSAEFARREAATFEDSRVVHAWDADRRFGDLYAKTLNLRGTAWDAYLLYGSDVRWEGDEPPQPAFWMHQLGAASGADWNLQLHPARLLQELLEQLGSGVEPSRVDLGLWLHVEGLSTVTRDRSDYSKAGS